MFTPQKKFLINFCLVILLGLGSYIIVTYLIPHALVEWDEAVSLLWIYKISHAIRTFNFAEFIRTTQDQYIYPPLQSWVIGLLISPLQFTVSTVRYFGLLWFIGSGYLMSLIALTTCRGDFRRYRISLIACIFYATSPLLLFLSALSMREMMGSTLTLLTTVLFFRFRQTHKIRWATATGLSLVLLFLVKYYYAAVILLAIAIEWLMSKNQRREFRALFLTACIGCGLAVLALSPRIWSYPFFYRFLDISLRPEFLPQIPILSHLPTENVGSALDRALFYPRSIVFLYGLTPLIGTIILASYLYAFRYLKNFRVRFLILLSLINLVSMGIWTNNLVDRLIATTMPSLFIVAAYAIDQSYEEIKNKYRIGPVAGPFLASVVLLYVFLRIPSLPSYVYAVGAFTSRAPVFNQRDYKDSLFQYDVSRWPKNVSFSGENQSDVIRYIASNVDLSKPYTVVGQSNEFSPQYLSLGLTQAKDRHDFPSLPYNSFEITVEVLTTSPYYDRDYIIYNKPTMRRVYLVAGDPTHRTLTKKTFSELGLTVTIYVPR